MYAPGSTLLLLVVDVVVAAAVVVVLFVVVILTHDMRIRYYYSMMSSSPKSVRGRHKKPGSTHTYLPVIILGVQNVIINHRAGKKNT